MLTDIKPRTIDEVKKEYWRAVVALDVAYNHFENAEPGFVDAAIAELAAASMKVVAILDLLSGCHCLFQEGDEINVSIKEKLTKEEAIRRHRLMWNYIADESARTRTRINKVDALCHFGWEKIPFNLCWCCEYAGQNYNTLCDHCPLDFAKGNANGVKYCSIGYTDANGTRQYGLYAKWDWIRRLDSCDSEKLDEYIDLAKRIANLSEKED